MPKGKNSTKNKPKVVTTSARRRVWAITRRLIELRNLQTFPWQEWSSLLCRHHRELLTAEFVCGITPIELNFPICARTCCKQNQCQSNCSIFKAPKKHTALHFPTCQNTLIFSTVLRHKCAHQHGITFYEWKDPSLFEPAVKLVTMFVVDLGTTLSCLRMMNDTVSDHRAGSRRAPTPSPRPPRHEPGARGSGAEERRHFSARCLQGWLIRRWHCLLLLHSLEQPRQGSAGAWSMMGHFRHSAMIEVCSLIHWLGPAL